MSWILKGTYTETCNCDLMCPCNVSFSHQPTYGSCCAVLAFHIREGKVEGTDMVERKVVIILETPGAMAEGNWRVGMFVDDEASDEQYDKLVRVFTGKLGGPMGAAAALIGELVGIERATIEMGDDRLQHRVRVGNDIDFEIEDIVPWGVESGRPVRFDGMFHPAGSNLTMAKANHSRINAFGISYEGRTGLSSTEFSWAA